MINLKLKIRKILYNLQTPILTYYIIKYFSRNNIYVEKNKISKKLLDLLKELKGYQSFSISTTGSLILFNKNDIIKISLGNVSDISLRKNYENYLLLKDTKLKNLVEYELIKKSQYYTMERLEPINLRNEEVEKIISSFFEKEVKEVNLKEVKEELFSNIEKLEKICSISIFFPTETLVDSCLMHGDLTKDNIMKNKNGDFLLIDLDRFTFNGIKGLDIFHYKVDKFSKQQGINYFDYLVSIEEKNDYMSYIYLLYRISSEYREGIVLNDIYYEEMKKTIKLLKRKS